MSKIVKIRNEALHMTDEEHDILVSLMRQIKDELQKSPAADYFGNRAFPSLYNTHHFRYVWKKCVILSKGITSNWSYRST